MKADKEGFMYPVVNEDTCIDCGMCVKVCPIVNECENKEPYQKSYGGYSKDERIINSCASGGVATALSLETIKQRGVVYGVRFIAHLIMSELTMKMICGHYAVQNMYNLPNRVSMLL